MRMSEFSTRLVDLTILANFVNVHRLSMPSWAHKEGLLYLSRNMLCSKYSLQMKVAKVKVRNPGAIWPLTV